MVIVRVLLHQYTHGYLHLSQLVGKIVIACAKRVRRMAEVVMLLTTTRTNPSQIPVLTLIQIRLHLQATPIQNLLMLTSTNVAHVGECMPYYRKVQSMTVMKVMKTQRIRKRWPLSCLLKSTQVHRPRGRPRASRVSHRQQQLILQALLGPFHR